MPDPLTSAGIIALVGYGRDRVGLTSMNRQPPASAFDGQWGFPIGPWHGYLPTRSQEYRPDDHHGVDIMYRRTPGGGEDARFPAGTPNGTSRWFMPDGITVHAARDGYLWSSGRGGTGLYVVIDHGRATGFASFYVHLDSLDGSIPMDVQRGAGKLEIKRGQVIGTVGFSPRDAAKLKHLHFELWYNGGAEAHVDPWPILEKSPLPT